MNAIWGKRLEPVSDWKQDFKIGDIVVAVCDIDYGEFSDVYVAYGTQGVVRKMGQHPYEWGIRWGKRKDIWYGCIFDRKDVRFHDGDFAGVDFVPLHWWERRHLDTLEEIMTEPEPPVNNPEMYDKSLFDLLGEQS